MYMYIYIYIHIYINIYIYIWSLLALKVVGVFPNEIGIVLFPFWPLLALKVAGVFHKKCWRFIIFALTGCCLST